MKIKKRYIAIIFFLLIILTSISILSFNLPKKEKELITSVNLLNKQIESDNLAIKSEIKEGQKVLINSPTVIDDKNINITLIVLGNKYSTKINSGSSIFEAMKKIEEESKNDNLFSFKYTDNASMGSFITEINGIKGTPGKYWIYYINGKLASVGVSNQILEEGDIISWNQEGM